VREVGGVRTVAVDEGYEVRGGMVRKVYWLGGEAVAVREGSAVHAVVGDHLGSVTVLAQGGSVAGATRYLPYGAIRFETGGFPTDRRFTGQRWEASLGLYDYKARFYEPALGRFLQPDPLVPEPGNPQALNRYAYVYHNPLRYTDPSGHCPWCVVIAKTLLQTAVDVGIDYLIARATGAEFHLVHSLAVNAAVNVTTLGVGSTVAKLRHLGKLAPLARHADEVTEAARALTQAAGHAEEAAEAIKVGEKAAQELTGQWHHVLSNRILRALEAHPTLHGLLDRNDLVVQALDEASHRGYQAWHRTYDDEVVEWLTDPAHQNVTREEFLRFLREIYARPEMRQRFPNALNQIDRLLEERP